ncbi:MAG: DUF4202 family protein [Nannocystaceae bacterium]
MFDPWPDDPDPRMHAAVAAFARHHDDDPRTIVRDGATVTVSHDYHARLCRWVAALAPDASAAVRLAALAQHVRRFERPRGDYPGGVEGYKRWRADAARFQAEIAASTLQACGYPPDTLARVRQILLKQRLRRTIEAAAAGRGVPAIPRGRAARVRPRARSASAARDPRQDMGQDDPCRSCGRAALLRAMDPAVLPHSPELLALVGLTPPA